MIPTADVDEKFVTCEVLEIWSPGPRAGFLDVSWGTKR